MAFEAPAMKAVVALRAQAPGFEGSLWLARVGKALVALPSGESAFTKETVMAREMLEINDVAFKRHAPHRGLPGGQQDTCEEGSELNVGRRIFLLGGSPHSLRVAVCV